MKRRRLDSSNQPQDPSTGSPFPGEPVFLAVGYLRRPHGVKGEIIMDVLTGFPERLRPGKSVYVGDAHEVLEIASLRPHGQALLVSFRGIITPEVVGRLRNATVFVKAENLPELAEGEYYHHQLVGLSVINEAGQALGVLDHILETGANDVYVVKTPDGNDLLLPAIEEVIRSIDLERKEMVVRPPEWQ